MKVVYHSRFLEVYASNPAASPGRLEPILEELRHLQFVEPEPATEEDLLRVHTRQHVESIKRETTITPSEGLSKEQQRGTARAEGSPSSKVAITTACWTKTSELLWRDWTELCLYGGHLAQTERNKVVLR